MKQGIHPDYVECIVRCTCGNTFVTRSTKPELRVDICSACHPFFTGTQKLIDTGGRVQRFADKFGSAKDMVAQREAAKKAEKAAKAAELEAAKKAEREAKAAAKAERAAAYAAKAAEQLLLKKPLLLKRLHRQRKLLPSKSRQTILHLESPLGLRPGAIFFLGGGGVMAPVG